MKKHDKKLVEKSEVKIREESVNIMLGALARLRSTLDQWKKSNESK